MDIVKVDKTEIAKLKVEAGKLVLTQKAENELIKLLDLKDYIDEVVEEVKNTISKSALSLYPEFKGVVGENLRAVYRNYGDKYETDNTEFLKTIITQRIDSDKIDEYIKVNGNLPEGVKKKERVKKLTISRL